MTLFIIKFTISGSLVLITAIRAAYTGVKFGAAIYALMIARASSPFPLRIFSFINSIIAF